MTSRPGNFCTGCCRDFGSLTAYDRHRVGPHDGDRRCRTDAELLARGYEKTAAGRWTLGRLLTRGRAFKSSQTDPSTQERP